MQLDPIPKGALKTGDILLCRIPELSFGQYMESVWAVLRHYVSTGQFSLDEATPLIHWIIGVFDQYHYCHASFWNGQKVVESRIKGGLRANDISTYSEDTVDVYHYQRDGGRLGDPALPVDPLLRKAQDLVDRHWTYGFDSAYLLAILCVTRWHRAEWVDRIRDLLVRHAPAGWGAAIDALFQEFRPQIDGLIESLIVQALEVVRRYRDREGYVCSQTVAVIYNEAGDSQHPAGTYKIDKPSYEATAQAPALLASPSPDEQDAAARETLVQRLRAQLQQLPTPPAAALAAAEDTEYETLRAVLREDTFYTPRDLAESGNTTLAGRLDLSSSKE
jgi:hypothetical protein